MKIINILTLTLLICFQGIAQQDNDTIISNNLELLKVRVIYFHNTNRCHTCQSIEENVRKTIDLYFADQLKKGVVDLYVLNCELPENTKLANKYNAYGSTLLISRFKKGKEVKSIDLSNWAFEKIHTVDIFIKEFKEKINEELKN
ncbi:MAG: hypothetical protein BWY27_01172 [Bacteroidetes bacterium ADurb.Bin234]|nr:MAG: hypothetical protein BWY27_01172 [Bacteroidetes bacterium ADurb.Bin234]